MKKELNTADNKCEILKTPPFGMVIFGASGQLAYNKLFPSLFGLFKKDIIKNNFFILGAGRTDYDDSTFRKRIENSIKTKFYDVADKMISDFCMHVYYIRGEYYDDANYKKIKERLQPLSECYKTNGNVIYNLTTPPFVFETIITRIIKNGLIKRQKYNNYFERLMIEKPFGYDFNSAKKLNKIILKALDDSQVFRIDHYLGKNTVQNILVFRFANTIFYDLWNNKNIEYIYIKFKERQGVEDRIEFFDKTGLIRDVFQNHILQLIALITMEKPKKFTAEEIQKQKTKIFKNIKLFNGNKINEQILLGQYSGYRMHKEELNKSCAETFFVTRLYINNNKWKDVPIYALAGKKMDKDETNITVVFRRDPKCILCKEDDINNKNAITFKIKPDQGVSIRFIGKDTGPKLCTKNFNLDFNYKDLFINEIDDYESVILECLYGDHTIFWNKKGVEYAWKILDPLLNKLKKCSLKEKNAMLKFYEPETEGPEEARSFIKEYRES